MLGKQPSNLTLLHRHMKIVAGDRHIRMPHRIPYFGQRPSAGQRMADKLYQTGWCKEESLAAGKWRWLAPEPVIIPADFGIEKGVWFAIEQGVRGVVVRDEQARPHVYMLTTRSSHYFETMTKHDRMPVLVDQQI